MITFQEEYFSKIKDELIPLQKEHWAERSEIAEIAELKTNTHMFQILEAADSLHIVTARDGLNLVGYFVSVISPHPYSTDLIMAENNAIFLSKKYRKGFTGYKLIRAGIKLLKKRANTISISLPAEKKFISIAKRLGLELKNYMFININ